ncbi:MAG TPA: hypothetical protein VGC11_12940 [Acidimicrobiia bacterium]
MSRMGPWLLAIALIGLAGCASAEEAACATIADDGIDLLQDLIDQVDAMTPEQMAAAAAGDELSSELEDRAVVLTSRADIAGCSPDEMTELLRDRGQRLTAKTERGQVFVDVVLSGALFAG